MMAMVDVDGRCKFSVDSQPKSIGLVWGLAATRRSVFIHQINRFYSSGDFGHDDSTYDESMITEPRTKVVSAEYTHVKTASRKTNIWK